MDRRKMYRRETEIQKKYLLNGAPHFFPITHLRSMSSSALKPERSQEKYICHGPNNNRNVMHSPCYDSFEDRLVCASEKRPRLTVQGKIDHSTTDCSRAFSKLLHF